MKIVHIFHSLKYSGAEIMYVDAAKYFQEKGCELYAIATSEELGEFHTNFTNAKYKVSHLPYPTIKQPIQKVMYLYNFFQFIKRENIDAVHIHSLRTYVGLSLITFLTNKKSVFTIHGNFATRKLTRPLHIIQRIIAKTLFNCSFHTIGESVYNNELIVFKNKTTIIDNWYSIDRFYPAKNENEKRDIREELEIDEDAFIIASVGGCSEIKRHCEIIKAISLVKKDIPKLIYLHLGTGVDEKAEKELASKLKIQKQVRFMGVKQNVRKFLIASDVYVMSSREEGISISTVEAMGCKIPTILYDVPGLRDFNKDGYNSILIQPDYKALAQTFVDVYQKKIDTDIVAESALSFVNQKYNVKNNSQKIYELYKSEKND